MDTVKVIKSIYGLPKGTLFFRNGDTKVFQASTHKESKNVYSLKITAINENHINELIKQGILIGLNDIESEIISTYAKTDVLKDPEGKIEHTVEINKKDFNELRKAWECLKLVNAELTEELNYYEQKLGRLNEANTESEFKNNQKAALTSLISCLDRYLKTIKNY